MQEIRNQFSELGSKISDGISIDKLRELESKEREKEMERNQKEQEMSDFVSEVKIEKRKKKQEALQLEQEVARLQQTLQNNRDQLSKQQKVQQDTLIEKDKEFTENLAEKERQLQQLMKQLADLKQKIKDEKQKLDDLEDKEEEIEDQRERYMVELERLDEELDELENDDEDQDLLIQHLQSEGKELSLQLAQTQDMINSKLNDIEKLKLQNQDKEQQLQQQEKLCFKLEQEGEDIDDLQQALQDAMDMEKKLFESNLGLMNQLKEVEMQSQEGNQKNQELEELINKITEHNYAERKSRAVERMLRELEDKLREKRRAGADIQRKIVRINELIGQQGNDYLKQFGVDSLKEKLDKFEVDLKELEREKESMRQRKQKVDVLIVGKDIKDINDDILKKSLAGLRDIERDVDNCNQRENDILIIDRLKKQFQEIEKEIGLDFSKKTTSLKVTQEKRQSSYTNRGEVILTKCKRIETDVLPNMSKIADDEDEIEILKGKVEILKQIKRSAQDLIQVDIEQNTNQKLQKIVVKKENAYEIIEQFNEMQDIELEINGIEKDLCQIEKRLKEYEQGLKQFEVDLKVDFYEDSVQEVQEQNVRIKKLDQQIKNLNEGIAAIQEAIQQAQSGNSVTGGQQDDLMNLQEMLEKLKEKRNDLEKIKKQLAKDEQALQGDLNDVNIEDISPDTLEKIDNEIVRLRDITDNQEKMVTDALAEMKKVKDNAQQLAFKKKADKRQECKQKLKKIKDNTDELERILSEIASTLDMIWKDAQYLKESEFSPTKNRPSLMYGQNGDKEKDIEIAKQNKEVESKQADYEDLKKQKEKLKKSINQFQDKYDQLPLETSKLTDYEGLIDALQVDLEDRSNQIKDEGKELLEIKLKKLKEDVEQQIEKFKQKKAVLGDCKKEEKEKQAEVQRIESQLNGFKLRVGQMERELMNQQSMNFKTNQEKKEMSIQLLKDVQEMKSKVNGKQSEIEEQRNLLRSVTGDLELIGDKIVTLDNLKQIYKQLLEFKKLQELKDELKVMGELIAQKENQVESFIKDILGGSQYECERKLKEAEALMDKLQKKIIELNNGMNDFEIDVKKGLLQNNGGDEEIQKEGKRLQDWNGNDRKELKSVEDQKNLIRKVLQKIKNCLNDMGQRKPGESPTIKLDASELEEMINEIETCVKKAENHWNDLGKLDGDLERRKEEWSKCMFKTGAKDALVEDIEKSLKDNIANLDELETKLKDIDKMLKGFNEVCNAMKDNPDYETRQAYVQKQMELNQEQKKKRDEIEQQKNALAQVIKKQKEARACGLKNLSLEDLQQLAKNSEETTEKVGKENQEGDKLIKDLQKRRIKLGDADILDNFKNRVESLNEMDSKIKDLERESQELEKIIKESAKMNPKGAQDALAQFNQMNKELGQCQKEKENLQKKLIDLKEKLKLKDLNRDDPFTFTLLIEEIKNLKKQMNNIDDNSNRIIQNMNFLRNKYGGVDVDKKIELLGSTANEFRDKLKSYLEDIEILRELCFEFDGYTSDAQEEDFIERLGVDLKEIGAKHNLANEENEQLHDAINTALKTIQRKKDNQADSKNLSIKEIEERATLVSQLEEQYNKAKRLIDDLNVRVTKHKKVFMAMQTKEKLRRRQQEVIELNKRLEQFESQLNEIEVDMQSEANKIKIGAEGGEALMKLFEQMFVEINGIKLEYVDIGQKLIIVNDDITDIRDSKMHQFDQLKGNIQIKKKILNYLSSVKSVRQQYVQLKSKYEANKPKKQVAYKAAKGDNVDQLLADWLNNNSCPVPISRLGGGYYMFGTKKIYAKIINGKLVIRVGGGYMSIDEFMFYYGAQELNKMIAYEAVDDNDEIDLDQALDGSNNQSDLIKHRQDGKSVIGVQQMKKRLSPRQTSPRTGSPNAQNQVKRSAQGVASPRVGSPRNADNQREGQGSGRPMQMSGRRSPGTESQSFLKKTVQKKTTEYQEESITYKKTERVELIMSKDKNNNQ